MLEVIKFNITPEKISISPKSEFLAGQENSTLDINSSIEAAAIVATKLDTNKSNSVVKISESTKNEMPVVVVFAQTISWGEGTPWGGYNGKIYIVNGSSAPIEGWRLDFESEEFKQNSFWNAERQIDSQTPLNNGYSFSNFRWNAVVAAKKKIDIGFNGSGSFSQFDRNN